MPWEAVNDPKAINLVMPMGPELGPASRPPSPGSVVSSAFNRENLVVNMARKLSEERNPIDLSYNPMSDDRVTGTKYEAQYADRFTYSYSAKDTDRIIADIEREEHDNEVLGASGWAGVGASVLAGLLDPTIFLPGGAYFKAGKSGMNFLKTGASVGAAGAAQVALQETGLQLSQQLRTGEETAFNIGSAALLSGFYGGTRSLG